MTLGIRTADRMEILTGLQNGDRAIASDQASYQAGEAVTPPPAFIASAGALFLFESFVSGHAQQATALPSAPAPSPAADNLAETQQSSATNPGETLTRQQAEQLALKNNPRISVASLLALAQKQVTRETRAGELPSLSGNATGVAAEEASRLSSVGFLRPPPGP